MSDRVAVMREGVIEQVGDGKDVYDHPQTAFVASFVGENNVFEGRVRDVNAGSASVDTPHGLLHARAPGNDNAQTPNQPSDNHLFERRNL